jgi:hypothetical protein
VIRTHRGLQSSGGGTDVLARTRAWFTSWLRVS